MSTIQQELEESIKIKKQILVDSKLISKIENACDMVLKTYNQGGKTLLGGNGGSAADAQHIAAEFVSRFYFDRPAISSIALTTDTSIITAIGNDYGYEDLFVRQLEAHAKPNDVFIAITTSGTSKNIIKALELSKNININTIVMTGNKKTNIDELCDICINIPSPSTPRIQECHILIGHMICGYVENELFGKNK